MNRGYFGIGIYHVKKEVNIGTLMRSALIMGAAFIFTIGRRYEKQCSDTVKAYKHIPLWHFSGYKEMQDKLPYDCRVVCIETADHAINLKDFTHPERAVYLLGAEDYGLPPGIIHNHQVVTIPSINNFCLNVSVAGSIIMYDRISKNE